jgi:hypothetical protein
LFITSLASGSVDLYTTSGTLVNSHLITGLSAPLGIAVSGSNVFVTNFASGTVGEYTTSGAVVNANLITGLTMPVGIAVSGNDLFIANSGSAFNSSTSGTASVSQYTTSGTLVNATLIAGLSGPEGIAVTAVPEPESYSLLLAGLGLIGFAARRKSRAARSNHCYCL